MGGELNKKMLEFNKKKKSIFDPKLKPYLDARNKLNEEDKYLSKKAIALFEEMDKVDDWPNRLKLYEKQNKMREAGEMLSEEGMAIESKLESISILKRDWQNAYIEKNIDLHSLSLIYDALRAYNSFEILADLSFVNEILPQFLEKYPSHPTLIKVSNMYNAIHQIKVGSKYIDFEAPTIKGEMVKLSDKIEGKVALIDLWATWCGSCIQHSKNMIPIYEKYHKKGFEIVGVAGEYRSSKSFKKALKRDNYPWLNLIELDKQNKIWEKYNIAGSGGRTYLVDTEGYIIAVHPTAEEVDKILSEILN